MTPVLALPSVQTLGGASVPEPEEGETGVTIGGELIPPDPLQPLPATAADGSGVRLRVEDAQVEVWGGIFNAPDAGWVPAAANLLWPGTQAYVTLDPAGAAAADELAVSRVRVIAAPASERVKLVEAPEIAAAAGWPAVAAVGADCWAAGRFRASSCWIAVGQARQLWQYESEAYWLGADPNAGLIVAEPPLAGGLQTFSWVRNDGTGPPDSGAALPRSPGRRRRRVRRAVVDRDAGGAHWTSGSSGTLRPATGEIALRLQANGGLLSQLTGQPERALTPILLAAQPTTAGDPSEVTFYVDTVDAATLEPAQGVFRMTIATDETGQGSVTGTPTLLLDRSQYRGPLSVSPDFSRLAYLAVDPEQPGLTLDERQPPNVVAILTLGRTGRRGQPHRLRRRERVRVPRLRAGVARRRPAVAGTQPLCTGRGQ